MEMKKNPRVIGVKNSSMPVQDIQNYKAWGGEDFVVSTVRMSSLSEEELWEPAAESVEPMGLCRSFS